MSGPGGRRASVANSKIPVIQSLILDSMATGDEHKPENWTILCRPKEFPVSFILVLKPYLQTNRKERVNDDNKIGALNLALWPGDTRPRTQSGWGTTPALEPATPSPPALPPTPAKK